MPKSTTTDTAKTPVRGKGGPTGANPPGRKPGSPKPAGSGRTKGTKNAVSAKTKETVQDIFDKHGPAAMTRLFAMAFGRKIRVGTLAGPGGEFIYPSEASQMKAIEILAKKLKADLSSQELTGADGAALIPEVVHTPRHVARAILKTLSNAAPDKNFTVSDSEPAEGRASASALAGEVSADVSSASDTSLNGAGVGLVPAPAPLELGDVIAVGTAGHCIQLRELLASGDERWAVLNERGQMLRVVTGKEAATNACEQLALTGKISH